MKIGLGERVIRCVAAVTFLLPAVTALSGWWRSRSQPAGRSEGYFPSGAILVPLGVVYLAVSWALWRPLPIRLRLRARLGALILGSILYFSGLGLVLGGRLALGEMYGVSSAFGARLYPGHRLVTTGPYAIVRHPMYLGALLSTLGGILIYRTWTMLLLAAHWPIFLIRARREDQVLAHEFGEQWQAYRQRVPGWLPRLPRSFHGESAWAASPRPPRRPPLSIAMERGRG